MTWSKLDKDRTDETRYRAKEMYGEPKNPSVWKKWAALPTPAVEPPKEQISCEVRILTNVGTAWLGKDMIDAIQLAPVDARDLQIVEALTIRGKLFTEQDVTLQSLQLNMTLRSGEFKQIEYMLADKLRGKFVRKGRGIQYWIAYGRLHYCAVQEVI